MKKILSAMILALCVLTVSCSETVIHNNDKNNITPSPENDAATEQQTAEQGKELPDVQKPEKPKVQKPETTDWLIPATLEFDSLTTFGMTGYSIYTSGDKCGIIDMLATNVGEEDFSQLIYCPHHGLSSPDVTEGSVELAEDLSVAPDCGYRESENTAIIHVYDYTRELLYVTGYSNGEFTIIDVTENESYLSKQDRIIAVMYDCDTALTEYNGAGMANLREIYLAENKDMLYGIIDNTLCYVSDGFVYEEIREGNDCFIVKQDGKYGYLGNAGQVYYPCVFEEANTAFLGAAWVKYGGKWGTVRF